MNQQEVEAALKSTSDLINGINQRNEINATQEAPNFPAMVTPQVE